MREYGFKSPLATYQDQAFDFSNSGHPKEGTSNGSRAEVHKQLGLQSK